MHIEKNIKKSLETINSSSREQKTLLSKFQSWVLSNRLSLRQKLLVNPINLTTIVAFVPLALGFSQFLSHTSHSSQTSGKNYFARNIPILTQFQQKLNFDTFEYISKSNTRDLLKPINSNLTFGQSNFLITIKKPDSFLNKKFNGISCDFYFVTSGNLFSNTSAGLEKNKAMTGVRNLDALPAYVQGLKTSPIENKNVGDKIDRNQNVTGVTTKSVLKDSLFLNQKRDPLTKQNASFGESKNKQIFGKNRYKKQLSTLTSDYTKRLPLIRQIKNINKKTFLSSEISLSNNLFYKDRLGFYTFTDQFNIEFQNLFLEKNISCFPNTPLNNTSKVNKVASPFRITDIWKQLEKYKISDFKTEVTDDFLIETLLQEFEKTHISEDVANFRFMSGYNYPDMTSQEIQWFFSGMPWKRKKFGVLKFEVNSLPVTCKEYTFSIKKFPEISIETNQISIKNPESNNTIYTGPGLILDSKRVFDWKTTGKKSLRSWFHTYISPLNPLNQSFENFFGIFPKPSQTKHFSDFSSFYNPSHFSIKWSSTTNGFFDALQESMVRFSPSSLNFQFPAEIEKENTRFLRTFDVNPSKNQETNKFITIPLLQIQQPVNSLTVSKIENLQNYSTFFTFTGKATPDYCFSTNVLTEKNFITKYTSGFYAKTASIFSKTKHATHVNIDNWEPITAKSWLIITQLSFAFFIFNILKNLADNYGRELLSYLLDFAASLGILDDSLKEEIELLLGQRDKGFRVVLESRKNFKHIVGIQKILPEIYEVVWFLRNSARDFSLSKTLPRGILLTGPPGTGKTLLVQALAGEAQVPVIVLSGSSLIEPGQSGAVKLEMMFQEAKQLAPCIVFIDEIETLAQKRTGVVQNPMGPDELIESLTLFEKSTSGSSFEQLQLAREKQELSKDGNTNSHTNTQEEHLSLLTQFLIELDGIQSREGVIVIGATNRPEVLDPAVLRPGRLDKILHVGLPGHQKRIEILQFYGQSLDYKVEIPWNYLGDRTAGFTAADLATLMNESTIKAILIEIDKLESNEDIEFAKFTPKHTIETIEHGIDRLTTSESEKYTMVKITKSNENVFKKTIFEKASSPLTVASKMSIVRLAYYQAGKILLSFLLETHPKSVVASLWPRRPTIRSTQIATNLQNSLFDYARLCEINDRLVGCYAGKAAEVLFIEQFSSSKYAQLSTLGIEDLLFAQKLIYSIFEKWSLYSKKYHIQQTAHLTSNINAREFNEIPEKLELYAKILEALQIPPMSQALEAQTSVLGSNKKIGMTNWTTQISYSIPWWQQQISNELEFVEKNFTNWSRLYLSNPEQSERNPEWLPPNEFYHNSSGLKNVKKAFANIQKTKGLTQTSRETKIQILTQIQNQSRVQVKNEFETLTEHTSESQNQSQFESSIENQYDSKSQYSSDLKTQKFHNNNLSGSTEFSDLEKTSKLKIKERYLPQKIDFSWNEISLLARDYPAHSLILQSFNKALVILNKNRELLDRIVVELLHKEILRQPEIEDLLNDFSPNILNFKEKVSTDSYSNIENIEKDKKYKLTFLESSWGLKSRKRLPRWIDFTEFSGETT